MEHILFMTQFSRRIISNVHCIRTLSYAVYSYRLIRYRYDLMLNTLVVHIRLTFTYRIIEHESYFTFNLYEDTNRWMHGAEKSNKKRKRRKSRAAHADVVQVTARRRTWRDFMPAKICRVIDSNMAVTSCKLSCYIVRRCRPLETR